MRQNSHGNIKLSGYFISGDREDLRLLQGGGGREEARVHGREAVVSKDEL